MTHDGLPSIVADSGLAAAFARVAAQQGDRLAVCAADGVASYRQLNRLANAVAREIRDADAPPDRPILLFLDPGLALAAAMLGVWRAGRFLVALDPIAAVGRNARIAADANACVAISESTREIPGPAIPVRLAPPHLATAAERGGDDVPWPTVARSSVAALTYTSGSTGAPKGVIQTHGAVLRNVAVTREALAIGPNDRATWLYPPSVNPALRDLATALLSGAELWPFSAASHDAEQLAAWLAEHEITVVSAGVTLFRQLAAQVPAGVTFPHVRAVKLGGEPVGRREITLFRHLFPAPARLYFGLGTTETGTITTCFFGHDEPLPSGASGAPLGRPAPEIEIELWDEAGEVIPVERELAGEIVVTGRDLAGGYWNQPELTRETFGDAGEEGLRRYRTGDLARRDAQGNLWYLGRASAGVKIRGLRIEVAEVERALVELPQVADAAVVSLARSNPREDASLNTRLESITDPELMAFLVASEAEHGQALTRKAIRRALATRLPSAMIPTRFRVVARLPMTPNGKLDRHALLDLARSAAPELTAERTLTYPRDPIETRLAALWCEILGRALIGIDESFLDLGGDSRTGLALFSAIEQRFGRALPLALLFEAPTVREQAVHLRAGIAREGLAPAIDWSATLVPESATTNRPRLFCVPAVDGYAFVYRPLAVELAATENPTHVVVLQFPGLDGTSAPLATVAALAHELVARLRTIQPHGPYALLGHSYGGLVAYEMARRLVESGEAIELLALCDSHTPDAVSFVARAVRGSEKLLLAARHIWRETAPMSKVTPFQGIVHLFAAASTFGHTVARAFRRRGGRTLVAHTVHEVRRASMAARGTYRFGPTLDLPATRVVLFRAAPGPESARRWLRFAEPSNGWARRFVRAIEVRDAAGDHIQMLNPPNVAGIAREISAARGPL